MKYKLRSLFSSNTSEKLKYLTILLILVIFNKSNSFSHTLNSLHGVCLTAKDYNGCITSNSSEDFYFNKPNNWKKYGLIKVDINNSVRKGHNVIFPSLNVNEKPIYLAVNCHKKMINVSGSDISWRGWEAPKENFEHKLLNNLCSL